MSVPRVQEKPDARCYNSFCPSTNNAPGELPHDQRLSKITLPNAHKVVFCETCLRLYQQKSFCDYCYQVYTASDEGDGLTWIGCTKCAKWNHPGCEILRNDGVDFEMQAAAQSAIDGDDRDLDYWCLKCRKSAEYKELYSKQKSKSGGKTPRNGGKKAAAQKQQLV